MILGAQVYDKWEAIQNIVQAYSRKAIPITKTYIVGKRIFDVVLSCAGLVIFSPVFLLVACLIWAEDRGPVFYCQERVGKNGKSIMLPKFRSMYVNSGDLRQFLNGEQLKEYYREFKLEKDPRVTRIGRLLRCGIDELPQLISVLKGDLSLVGPRPLIRNELEENYGPASKIFTSITPGLTGYWQAYARNDAKYVNMRRQQMELYYIFNASPLLDCKIIIRTITRLCTNE